MENKIPDVNDTPLCKSDFYDLLPCGISHYILYKSGKTVPLMISKTLADFVELSVEDEKNRWMKISARIFTPLTENVFWRNTLIGY